MILNEHSVFEHHNFDYQNYNKQDLMDSNQNNLSINGLFHQNQSEFHIEYIDQRQHHARFHVFFFHNLDK
jgi:hypothetical protein